MLAAKVPRFPRIGLGPAIMYAMRLHHGARDQTFTRAEAATLMRFNLSGPTNTKLAAMQSYGLIEVIGPSEMKLTERAIALCSGSLTRQQRADTLLELALKPPLFEELLLYTPSIAHWPALADKQLPQKEMLKLLAERNFSREAATTCIAVLSATVKFVRSQELRSTKTDSSPVRISRAQPLVKLSMEDAPLKPDRPEYLWDLGDGVYARLQLTGSLKPRHIALLAKYVDLVAQAVNREDDS
ncbi:MAG: hypothetical protein ABW252_21555 [Polyangiales bacterium]